MAALQYIIQKLLRRAEESFSSYWDNPDSHTMLCALHNALGEPDELCILGGLGNVIPHRSLSGSPLQMTQRVSDVRTQASSQASANGSLGGSPKQMTYQEAQARQTAQDFNFTGLGGDFGYGSGSEQSHSAPLPTYEQIMSNGHQQQHQYSSYPPPATPLDYGPVPPPTGAGYPGEFGNYPPAHNGADMVGGEGGGENVWRSFVGALMTGPTEAAHSF